MEQFSFPKEGVSLRYLLNVLSKDLQNEKTTTEVGKWVLDLTREKKTSFVQYLKNNDETKAFVGIATNYVVHVHAFRFKEDTLDALSNYFEQNQDDDVFVWLDIFSLDLHSLQRHLRIYPWWDTKFQEDLKDFEAVIVVWKNWWELGPLSRTWCVWEIFAALQADRTVVVALPQREFLSLEADLIDHFSELVVNLKDFDVIKTESYDRRMKKRTLAAIKKSFGEFALFNENALENVKHWWFTQASLASTEVLSSFKLGSSEAEVSKRMSFYNSLIFLARSMQLFDDAFRLADVSIQFATRNDSYKLRYPRELARDLNNFAVLCSEAGKIEDAAEFSEKSISLLKEYVFEQSENQMKVFSDLEANMLIEERAYIATSLNNLGNLYFNSEVYDLAIERYTESIEIKTDVYGPDHPTVASGLNNLGVAYKKKGDHASAERIYRQALQLRVRHLGLNSLEVAQTRFNLAEVLFNETHLSEAKKEAKKAYDVVFKYFGKDDALVSEYKFLLETIKERLKQS